MKQLTGLDTVFLRLEDTAAHMHVSILNIYDQSTAVNGKVRFKQILNHIEDRLHTSSVYRRKLVNVPLDLDNPYWIEHKGFDLEFHVRHIAVPEPGDWRQFCIELSRLHSRPLDMSKPLWEMYVIEGLKNIDWLPKGSYAILTKIHHAAIDGVTGAEITYNLHDLSPKPEKVRRKNHWIPESNPSQISLLTRATLNNVINPLKLGKKLLGTIPKFAANPIKIKNLTTYLPKTDIPESRFNRKISPYRVFEGRAFQLDHIRAIKKVVAGATVNDVVLTICGGALRKYLMHTNELPEKSLIAMNPISVRSQKEKGKGGNQIALMYPAIGTHVEEPLNRLKGVYESTCDAKEKFNAAGGRELTDMTQYVPSATFSLVGKLFRALSIDKKDVFKQYSNCVITNVPGPQKPLYMNSAEMVCFSGLGPIADGLGLCIIVTSYNGRLFITSTACREMMPDPEFFSQCLQESFNDLKNAALGTQEKKQATSSKSTLKKKPAAATAGARKKKPAAATAGARKKKSATATAGARKKKSAAGNASDTRKRTIKNRKS